MDQPTTRREWLLAGGILAAAAAWRLIGLGQESLWTDEIAAVLVSRRSLLEVWVTIGIQDVNPPLFYSLLHFWLWAGSAEWWLRLFPAICGISTVALTWRLGRKLAGPAVGLLAALFAAFSPLSIYLSRELRYHTLAALLAAGALLVLLKLWENNGRGNRRWLFFLLLFGLYTHYFFIFIPAVMLVWWWMENREYQVEFGPMFSPLANALAAFLPWIVIMAWQAARQSYRFRPLLDLPDTFFNLAAYLTVGHADARLPFDQQGISKLWFILALAPFWAMLAAGAWQWKQSRAARFSLVGFALPALVIFAAGRFWPVYGHRYFLPFMTLFFIWMAAGALGLYQIRKPFGVAVVLTACVLMTGSSLLQRLDARYQREDWRGLSKYLQAAIKPGDGLLVYNEGQAGPLRYYWERQTGRPPDYQKLLTGNPLVFAPEPLGTIESRVELFRRQHKRLWLLDHFAHMYDPPTRARRALELKAILDPAYSMEAAFRIPMRVYWRDRITAIKETGAQFAPQIDFGTHRLVPLQLEGDWSHTHEPWAWMGKTATVYLRAPGLVDRIAVKVWPTPKYYSGRMQTLKLFLTGRAFASFDLTGDQPRELVAALPEKMPAGIIVPVTLWVATTFDPAMMIGGTDHTPKSVMISSIGLR